MSDRPAPSPGPFAPDRHDPPRARDGDVAIGEEFEIAIQTGTAAALALFIARHPDHDLTPRARARLAALAGR